MGKPPAHRHNRVSRAEAGSSLQGWGLHWGSNFLGILIHAEDVSNDGTRVCLCPSVCVCVCAFVAGKCVLNDENFGICAL